MPSCASLTVAASKRRRCSPKSGCSGVVGSSEMRVDRVDRSERLAASGGIVAIELVVAEAETVHAGVDLEVAGEADAAARGRQFERVAAAGVDTVGVRS